jgi:holliday junction DNA helicase RuvA
VIGLLQGTVSHGTVLTGAGVGYVVWCPFELVEGETVTVHIHHVQSEAGDTLYGFADVLSRAVFEALIRVTGVAGKTALALVRELGVAGLAGAIGASDAKALTAARGVGPKLATKIVAMVELPEAALAASAGVPGQAPVDSDLVIALLALGYSEVRAQELARTVETETAGLGLPTSQQLKVALAHARAA